MRCKNILFLVVGIVVGILLIDLVSASFTLGNYSIETEYGAGEFLKGWLNISFQNEKTDSTISCFNSNITLINFLEKSGNDFECFPEDCESYYVAGNGNPAKSFSLNRAENKIIGLNFKGTLKEGAGGESPIQNISFKVESNAKSGCFQPLKIDILNDNSIEWRSFSSLEDFSCSVSHGCFNSSESLADYYIGTTPYCEKISVPYQPKFKIGANFIKGTTSGAEFKMQVYNTDLMKLSECLLPSISSSGENFCIVSLNFTELKDIFVCVNANKVTDYKIKGENIEPCGFYGLDNEEFTADYDIFAKGSKFAPLGSFTIGETEFQKYNDGTLKNYLKNYLYERFNYNCTNGCVVPIKFTSGINQAIILSDLQLSYDTKSGLKNENNFYDLTEEQAKINMGFKKLDLKQGNFSVPSSDGNYKARVYLDENLIAEKEINVFASVNIKSLNSQEVPASVPYKLVVYVSSSKNIISYKWDFGDGTTEETTKNETVHTYSKIGEYTLKIEVINSLGKKSVKSFLIKVGSPKEFVKLSLETKRKNLNETKKQLKNIANWFKEELEKKADLDKIETELDSLEKKYNDASTSGEYVEIMSSLSELKVPYSLQIEKSSGDFFPDVEKINVDYLVKLGVKGENVEKYKKPIASWFNENIEMKIESDAVYLYYDEKQPILTSFKLKIKPKKQLGETYLIIDKSYDEITFREDYKEKAVEEATAITFSELEKDEEKTIEFVFPEKTEIFQLPLYISPEFSELPENGEISVCNNNKICEKEIGETEENCLNDCHVRPWKKIITYLLILLFVAFVVYIVLQEWYKRHYEGHLFKNKNDLFNLISFIINALNQKWSMREIVKKLKEYKWNSEQITYALKKMRGKRTGMWEIPVFKWLEKRKLAKELEKRRQLGLQLQRQV